MPVLGFGRRLLLSLLSLLLIVALVLLGSSCADTTQRGQGSTGNPYTTLLRGIERPQTPLLLHRTDSTSSTRSPQKTPSGAVGTGVRSTD